MSICLQLIGECLQHGQTALEKQTTAATPMICTQPTGIVDNDSCCSQEQHQCKSVSQEQGLLELMPEVSSPVMQEWLQCTDCLLLLPCTACSLLLLPLMSVQAVRRSQAHDERAYNADILLTQQCLQLTVDPVLQAACPIGRCC